MSEWISVNDALPEDHSWVLVWHTGYGTPKKALFHEECYAGDFELDGGGRVSFLNDWWEVDGHNKNVGAITHWMPLPAPPEGVKVP